MSYRLICSDLLEALAKEPSESFSGCLCDPPYHLTTGKKGGSGPASVNLDSPYGRARITTGFMGQAWDGGDIAFQVETWREVYRVLKPGSFLLAFGGTRTYHRLTCAIEDAGFEIRDSICCWLYGSGFPKSHNISAAIDCKLGAEREIVGVKAGHEEFVNRTDAHSGGGRKAGWERDWKDDPEAVRASHMRTAPATPEAKAFDGYGSALKPAWEPVIVAMKPLAGTYAENAITHGVAGLNIDGCRIGYTATNPPIPQLANGKREVNGHKSMYDGPSMEKSSTKAVIGGSLDGRWPSNVILSHTPDCREVGTQTIKGDQRGECNGKRQSGFANIGAENGDSEPNARVYGNETVAVWECSPDCPVRLLDEQSGERTSGAWNGNRNTPKTKNVFGDYESRQERGTNGDSGGASRFFKQVKPDAEASRFWYISKVSTSDCPYNTHPCRKPVDLTTYLAKLILPPAGKEPRRCLVPFAGSGSEMLGANAAGFDQVVGIEREAEYVDIARRRFYDECPMFAEVEVE